MRRVKSGQGEDIYALTDNFNGSTTGVLLGEPKDEVQRYVIPEFGRRAVYQAKSIALKENCVPAA